MGISRLLKNTHLLRYAVSWREFMGVYKSP